MFSSAPSSTRWLKRRSCEASPTIAATVSRSGPASRRAASSSRRADALPRTAASSRSSRASITAGTGPVAGASASNASTLRAGRKRRPALRRVSRSEPRAASRRGADRAIASSTVARVPANRLAPTARPRRLQPVRPNSASGDNQAKPNGPRCNQSLAPPVAATYIGASITQAQTRKATTTPAVAARGGVCGRQTANASAGASVASAENETAPTSASASLPPIWRL